MANRAALEEMFKNYREQLKAKGVEHDLAAEAAFILTYKNPAHGRTEADYDIIDRAFQQLMPAIVSQEVPTNG